MSLRPTTLPTLLVLLSLLLAPARAAATSPPSAPATGERASAAHARDALKELRALARRLQRRESPLDSKEERFLRDLLEALRRDVVRDAALGLEADPVLLDLVAAGRRLALAPTFPPGSDPAALVRLAAGALEQRLGGPRGPEAARGLAETVLANPKDHPSARRAEAARALYGHRFAATLGPLFAAAVEDDLPVAEAALEALIGWPHARVNGFFLEELERGGATAAARRHLQSARAELGAASLERLQRLTGRLYLSGDWRDAARAGRLVPTLDTGRAMPVLIEALTAWNRRGVEGTGSRRIVEELVVELRRRSGRGFGSDPALWVRWWRDVLSGEALLPEEAAKRGEPLTSAAFFGLRLASDRVLFLVDRSGSMDGAFGSGGETRYEEAVSQLFLYLQAAGPSTRFGLCLFHDGLDRWRTRLVEAGDAAKKRARRWLAGKRPKGGTELRAGLFDALGADKHGRVDAADVEADTLVILCDGATANGSAWVAPWLASVREELQLVIHGIQIGASGDGTLEALANGSGGTFVRVDR